MANRLEFLLNNLPSWVRLTSNDTADGFAITANPKLFGGENGESFSLVIKNTASKIEVSENEVGRKLPPHCPERHINKGGIFCIGLNAGELISSDTEAQQWWNWLEEYLRLQQTASQLGVWPVQSGLAHGKAAEYQIKIEEIGAKLGWGEKVLNSIFLNQKRVISLLPNYKQQGVTKLRKRAACPLGCIYKRKLAKIKNCHEQDFRKLIDLETAFHQHTKDFIKNFKECGGECCQTMKNCPFK